HRPSGGDSISDHRVATDAADPVDAGGEGTDPGNDQTVGGSGGFQFSRHDHFRSGTGQCAFGGAKVARAVIEHDDLRGGSHRTPSVLGRPPLRGSSATASRSARATALNCASTT